MYRKNRVGGSRMKKKDDGKVKGINNKTTLILTIMVCLAPLGHLLLDRFGYHQPSPVSTWVIAGICILVLIAFIIFYVKVLRD